MWRNRAAILLAMLAVIPAKGADGTDHGGRNPLPLARITLLTDIDAPIDDDDPGTGGNFDLSTYFENRLADTSAITLCVDQIEGAASDWAALVKLVRSFDERKPASLTLQYVQTGLPGLFEISYEVKHGSRAKVSVNYFALDGSKQSPETALELIDQFSIDALQDKLDRAILCKATAP